MAQLQTLLENNPESPTYNNDLGFVWADNNMNLDQAEKLIRKALEEDKKQQLKSNPDMKPDEYKDNPSYLDSLAWVLYKKKQYAEAKKYMLMCVKDEEEGKNFEICDHLADIHLALGEKADAVKVWKQGLKNASKSKRRPGAEDRSREEDQGERVMEFSTLSRPSRTGASMEAPVRDGRLNVSTQLQRVTSMATTPLAHRLADYAVALRFDQLPAAAVHEAKRRFLDSIATAVGAMEADAYAIARRCALRVQSEPGAGLFGGGRSSVEWATFVNGLLIRYLDFNDTYLSLEPAHPSDNLAAVLAVGDMVNASGPDLITAAVLAYEIQCRFAMRPASASRASITSLTAPSRRPSPPASY